MKIKSVLRRNLIRHKEHWLVDYHDFSFKTWILPIEDFEGKLPPLGCNMYPQDDCYIYSDEPPDYKSVTELVGLIRDEVEYCNCELCVDCSCVSDYGAFCNELCSCKCREPELPILYVKRTPTGFGVFSYTDIPADTFVAQYLGEVITTQEANIRPRTYLFDMDFNSDKYCIDATNYGNVSRYFNHSCSPNMKSISYSGGFPDNCGMHRIGFKSLKKIKAHQELTFNYTPNQELVKLIECKCGSIVCRGFVF